MKKADSGVHRAVLCCLGGVIDSCIYMINNKTCTCTTNQHNTTIQQHQRKLLFPKKHELPQVGFKPTTICSLDECSATELLRQLKWQGAEITNTTPDKAKGKGHLSLTVSHTITRYSV